MMSQIRDEVTGVKQFFASRQVPLCEEWLESCIRWCKDEYLGSRYTLKDLQVKIFEQWLLLDLRDVEIASLPPDLKNQKKFILNGEYSLQLMQSVDISRPKHWQLQRLRGDVIFTKNNWQDSEAIGTGKRVLQLTLTDGVQEVEAMEYKPIPSLNINLAPGLKVRLTGPITIRRGILMLEQHHLKLLGGEVEEIAVSHAPENVIARKLNMPENPNPKTFNEKMDIDNEDTITEVGRTGAQHSSTTLHDVQMKNTINRTQNIYQNGSVQPHQTALHVNKKELPPQQRVAQNQYEYPDLDDELRIAEEINLLLEAESEFPLNTRVHTTGVQSSSTMCSNVQMKNSTNRFQNTYQNGQLKPRQISSNRNKKELAHRENVAHNQNEYPDLDDETRIEEEMNLLLEAESAFPSNTREDVTDIPMNSPELFTDDIDLSGCDIDKLEGMNQQDAFENNVVISDIRESLTEVKAFPNIEKSSSSTTLTINENDPSSSFNDNADAIFQNIDIDIHLNKEKDFEQNNVPKTPVITIDKLLKNMSTISKGVFKVKAKFKAVTKKLSFSDDAYHLVICIEDASGKMDVRLSSEIISDLTGYCATALISLKSRVLDNDKIARETVLKAISRLKDELLKLDNLMEVQIDKDDCVPTVINILF